MCTFLTNLCVILYTNLFLFLCIGANNFLLCHDEKNYEHSCFKYNNHVNLYPYVLVSRLPSHPHAVSDNTNI